MDRGQKKKGKEIASKHSEHIKQLSLQNFVRLHQLQLIVVRDDPGFEAR